MSHPIQGNDHADRQHHALPALSLGLGSSDGMSWNASAPELYELAIMRGEAQVAEGGSLVVTTGSHTGRSPRDKFIVRDAATENTIWWDNTAP